MFRIDLIAVFLFTVTSLFGQWTSDTIRDPFTDVTRIYTQFQGEGGVKIEIFRKDDGKYWIQLTVPSDQSFNPDGLFELLVDTGKTLEIDPIKLRRIGTIVGKPQFLSDGNSVAFVLFNGESLTDCGFIGQLLKGERLFIRYQVSDLKKKMHQINLEGCSDALLNSFTLRDCH